MRIHHLDQGSKAWLDFRKSGVTASEMPVIMGSSPYQKITDLFLQKIDEAPPTVTSFAMQRGTNIEPLVREKFRQIMGDHFEPMVVSHNIHEFAIASLDGYHVNEMNSQDSAICEIKYNKQIVHTDAAINEKIPLHHMHQIQFQLFVSGASVAFYVSCNGNIDDLVIIEVKPNAEMQDELFKKAQWFHNCVLTRTPPTEPIADDLIELIEKYEEKALQAKKLEEEMEEIKGIIRDITPKDRTIAWNKTTCAWRSRTGNVNYGAIPDLIGINLDLYRKPPSEYFEVRCKL